jgi:hypothetical protein
MRLLGQQLHENEVLDGVFNVSVERAIGVTSERIMILSGGGAKGWALTSIPWRVVTGVELSSEEPGGANTVHVSYTAKTGRMTRKDDPQESDGGADLCPEAIEDAERMVHLMNARRPRINV